jgi:hypothetical protein
MVNHCLWWTSTSTYLGVMLAADCRLWRAHTEYVVAKATKATKASRAIGSVLHNPTLPTEIRRIVLFGETAANSVPGLVAIL